MKLSPFEKRLMDLQLEGRTDDDQEVAFLKEYLEWRDNGGPQKFEANREKKRLADLRRNSQARYRATKP